MFVFAAAVVIKEYILMISFYRFAYIAADFTLFMALFPTISM